MICFPAASFPTSLGKLRSLVLACVVFGVAATFNVMASNQASAQLAQLADSQSGTREFHDKQGEVFITGVLSDVSGSDVTIAEEGSGASQSFNINKFSDEDRIWIRKSVSDHKKWLKKKKAADKVIEDLKSAQSVKVIKACKKLKSFGTAANHASTKLKPLLQSQDPKVVLAAFVCLSNTSKIDENSIKRLFAELNSSKSKVFASVSDRPEKFVETLPRFEKLAIPFLRAIAYEAKLNVQPVTNAAEPEKLGVIGGDKTSLRIAACKAVSKIKHDASPGIILNVIEVSDQGSAPKRDAKTVKEGLKALGKLGMNTPEVQKILAKHEAEFAEEVEKARSGLK